MKNLRRQRDVAYVAYLEAKAAYYEALATAWEARANDLAAEVR